MVMLHGFTNFSGLWAWQAIDFAYRGYRILLPDLSGHGLSAPAETVTTVDDLAEDVCALLDHEDAASAIVCGLSLGGMTALTAAAHFPERIDAIVVAGASGNLTRPESQFQIDNWIETLEGENGPRQRLEKAWPKLCTEAFRKSPQGQAYYSTWISILESASGKSLANIARGMKQYDVTNRFDEIQCPSLVITGIEDQIIPAEASRNLRHSLKYAQLIELSAAGHLCTLDGPSEIAQAMAKFLSASSLTS